MKTVNSKFKKFIMYYTMYLKDSKCYGNNRNRLRDREIIKKELGVLAWGVCFWGVCVFICVYVCSIVRIDLIENFTI